MDQIKIGKFIAYKRKLQNMTQAEFAERLGVTNKSVSRWETGKNMPDVSLFIPICELLDISVNEFIAGEEIETDNVDKSNKIIVETIQKSNRTISKARIIFYIAIIIINALFCIGVPLTASPSDAMAVPLAGVLSGTVTAAFVACLKIKPIFKFAYIPITAFLFLLGSLFYFEDALFDYGLPYAAIIAILQFTLFLLAFGIEKLINIIKQKVTEKNDSNV